MRIGRPGDADRVSDHTPDFHRCDRWNLEGLVARAIAVGSEPDLVISGAQACDHQFTVAREEDDLSRARRDRSIDVGEVAITYACTFERAAGDVHEEHGFGPAHQMEIEVELALNKIGRRAREAGCGAWRLIIWETLQKRVRDGEEDNGRRA